jgi:pimeloyl-ACP methyl ester carboxylesterase
MITKKRKLGSAMLATGLTTLILSACGGGHDQAASGVSGASGASGMTMALPESVFSILSPLAPSTDLGGADVPQADYSSQSLYNGSAPRPGPDILYAAAPRAPQLENTGIWKARPILVSGASAYRRGEYLYQDFLYDDRGALLLPDPMDKRVSKEKFSSGAGTYSYPIDPVYANNAADIVELRIKPQSDSTAFRLTMNSLLDPEKLAFTIALGDSPEPRAFPFGANVKAPAQFFLTVHGNQAVMTNAQTGAVVLPAPAVKVDTVRRQFQVDVPITAWNPGRNVVRVAAGAGLWDAARSQYLVPSAISSGTSPGGAGASITPAAFFNVAFRFNEPVAGPFGPAVSTTNWRDSAQAIALATGDISQFYANVNFAKLADNVNDDMTGQAQGVPARGPINRIFASHVETKQGVDFSVGCGSAPGCKGEYLGQLQPYTLYIPAKAPPKSGYGLTLLLHSLSGNHTQYFGTNNQSQLGERGQGHLVATALARGPDGWYVEDAEADVFEMWADIARNYPLNPEMTSVTGYSMGGHGTYKLSTRYPDLFARAHVVVGSPALGGFWIPPAPPGGGEDTNTYHLLPGLRHIPVLIWEQAADEGPTYTGQLMQAQRLNDMNYRYRLDTFVTGEHLTLYMHDSYAESANFLGDAMVNRNPAHVSYVANPPMDVASRGLVGNHAYWVSNIAVRGDNANPRGSVDVVSRAFGDSDSVASETQTGAGVIAGALGLQAYVSQFKTWSLPVLAPVSDRLEIVARNVGAVSVNMQRAKLTCNAALVVDSDGPLTVNLEGCSRQVKY